MSQISTRSRGSTKKVVAVPKLRKKVAPKVVSTRPKKKNDTSQTDPLPPASKTTQSTSPTPDPIHSEPITPQASLANEITIATLNEDNDHIPLPTLPSEEAADSLSTSLQLSLPSEADICTDVGELFADQHTGSSVDQDGGIGEELLSLSHTSHSTMLERTPASVREVRTGSTEAAVSNGCHGNENGDSVRVENVSSPEAVSPVSDSGDGVCRVTGEGVPDGVGVSCDVSSSEPAAEERSVCSERPKPTRKRSLTVKESGDQSSPQAKHSQSDSTVKESGDQSSPQAKHSQSDSTVKESGDQSSPQAKHSQSDSPVKESGDQSSPPQARNSQTDSTVKESGDRLSPPRAKRKRNTVVKERKAPDRTTMTMQELIYYNPTANPMQAAREEREKRRGSTVPPSPEKDTNESETGSTSGQTRQSSVERSGENEDRLVPQLRIGADGNIVIDEASMVMATTRSPNPYEDSEAIVETSGQVSSDSFRKGYKITRWSKDETTKFFKALSHVGTDFTMMTLLVPNRSRKELKNKFKREEKRSPHLVAQALKNQIKVQKVSS